MNIAVNGTLCEESEAVVSVYDHGFLYGIGLFETFRTYDGVPFLLKEHLRRLADGCGQLAIGYEPDEAALRALIGRLLAANGLADAYFRLTVSAGVDVLGLPAEPYRQPTEIVYVKSLPSPLPADAGKPLQLLALRRNSPEGDVRLKSLHYMNNILGKRELQRYPWAHGAEGLYLNEAGFVAEGIVSNVFFVSDGVVRTPSVDTGILPGVTRAHVLGLAGRLGYRVEEGHYRFEELAAAEELFLTNSIQEIVPVHALFEPDGTQRAIGRGRVRGGGTGPVTRRLMDAYRTG